MSDFLKALRDRPILAIDGLAGALNDLHFDERRWMVRYLSLDDTQRRPGKRVLVRASLVSPEHREGGEHVAGYRVHACDGWIGQVEDLRVGPEWSIAALVVSTRDWLLPGWTVEVPARAVDAIDRRQRLVHVRLTRHEVRALPHAREP